MPQQLVQVPISIKIENIRNRELYLFFYVKKNRMIPKQENHLSYWLVALVHMVLNMPRYIHIISFCVSNSIYIQFKSYKSQKHYNLSYQKGLGLLINIFVAYLYMKTLWFKQSKANPPLFVVDFGIFIRLFCLIWNQID